MELFLGDILAIFRGKAVSDNSLASAKLFTKAVRVRVWVRVSDRVMVIAS